MKRDGDGNTAVYLGIVLMIILITPLIIFAPAIIQLFDPSAHPVLLQTGTTYMRINTVFLPFAAVAMVANGALRGAGDSTPGMLSTLFTRAIGALSLAYLLAIIWGYGSVGVWIALALGMVFEGIYMGWRWRGDVWLRVALHKTTLYRQHLHHLPLTVQAHYLREVRTPLMAQPQTVEQVNGTGVVYQTADQPNHHPVFSRQLPNLAR